MKKIFSFVLIFALISASLSCSKKEDGAGSSGLSFRLSDTNGKKVSLDDYKGRVVMLEFFATWCPPCHMSAPEINAVYKKYKDKKFVVLAVSVDRGSDAIENVNAFIKQYDIGFPVLMDDGNVARNYGVTGIPTSFIIDKKGKLISRHAGLVYADMLSKEIEPLL
jgi:peroxiredoxin